MSTVSGGPYSTSGDAAVACLAIPSGTNLNDVVIQNNGAQGYYSIDGGVTWAALLAGRAVVGSNAVITGSSIQIRRIVGGTDLSGVWMDYTTVSPSAISPSQVTGLSQNLSGTAIAFWRNLTTAREIDLVGDSTFDKTGPSPQIYTELALHTISNGRLAGVTVGDFGSNGNTLANWVSGTAATGKRLVDLPSTSNAVILHYGINDVRLGATSENQLTALLITAVDKIAAQCPSALIALCVPNAFTTNDVGAAGYVVPNASAQAYSTLMKNAYYRAWQARPWCVFMDLQAEVLGTVCRVKPTATGTNPMMADQLHPSFAGQTIFADWIAAVFDVRPDVVPYLLTTRKYAPFAARAAETEDYNNAHTIYPFVVYDPYRYTILFDGYVGNSGTTFIDFYNYTGNTSNPAKLANYLGGSIVATSSNIYAVGLSGWIDQVGYLRAIGTYPTPPAIGTPIVIARHRFGRDSSVEALFYSPVNRYHHVGTVTNAAGDGSTLEITGNLPEEPRPANLWSSLSTTDSLTVGVGSNPGQYTHALTGCTFTYPSANVILITKTAGTFLTAYIGFPVSIYGTHELESVLSGVGVPTMAGAVGDYYYRKDTPAVALQRIYACTTAGAAGVAVWTAIL